MDVDGGFDGRLNGWFDGGFYGQFDAGFYGWFNGGCAGQSTSAKRLTAQTRGYTNLSLTDLFYRLH
jgi:hypothetical protein